MLASGVIDRKQELQGSASQWLKGVVPVAGWLAVAVMALASQTVRAELSRVTIDFESGFVDKQEIGTISVAGVDVTVGTLSAHGKAFISEVGGDVTGFAPRDASHSEQMGQFFVSDEPDGLSDRFDYVVDFSSAVSNVSLDAYDYRADGGARRGDTVTLNAYDAMNRLIGSDVYTITGQEVDGNAYTFGVQTDGIRRVELVHSRSDVGAAIDNISFDIGVSAAPEPAEWAMIGLGLVVLGAAWRQKREARPL